MKSAGETSIRLPGDLRDRIRRAALKRGVKQATVIELALRELEQAEFLRSVAAIEWDDEAEAEARAWDEAGSEDPIDPWDPHP